MASSKIQSKNQDKDLECSICFRDFVQPKLIPCLHTFCLECLEKWCQEIDEVLKPCPLCRRVFNVPGGGLQDLPTNELLYRLTLEKGLLESGNKVLNCDPCFAIGEEVVADAFCMECQQSLCRRCKMLHLNVNSTKSHKLVGIQEKPSETELHKMKSSFCLTHSGKMIEFYCCDCNKALCYSCHVTEHSGHLCKAMLEVANSKRKLALHQQSEIERICKEATIQIKNFKAESSTIAKYFTSVKASMQDQCEKVINQILEYKNDRINNVEVEEASYQKLLNNKINLAELYSTELKSFLSYSRMVMERGTDCEILRVTRELNDRAEELIKSQHEHSKLILSSDVEMARFEPAPALDESDLEKIMGALNIPKLSGLWRQFINTSTSTQRVINLSGNVAGVTVVDGHIYLVQYNQSQVSVYDAITLTAQIPIKIAEMKVPQDLTGCSHNKALYISINKLQCIHRVNLSDNTVKRFKVKYSNPQGLAITLEHNVLVTICDKASRVLEYTTEGQLIRDIEFYRSIEKAWQTVQLSTDQFIICHGGSQSSLHRLCVINSEGEIIKSYGRGRGGGEGHLNMPCALTTNSSRDLVFITDSGNDRVLMFSKDLIFIGQIQIREPLSGPKRLFYDSSSAQLMVSDASGHMVVISADNLE